MVLSLQLNCFKVQPSRALEEHAAYAKGTSGGVDDGSGAHNITFERVECPITTVSGLEQIAITSRYHCAGNKPQLFSSQ